MRKAGTILFFVGIYFMFTPIILVVISSMIEVPKPFGIPLQIFVPAAGFILIIIGMSFRGSANNKNQSNRD